MQKAASLSKKYSLLWPSRSEPQIGSLIDTFRAFVENWTDIFLTLFLAPSFINISYQKNVYVLQNAEFLNIRDCACSYHFSSSFTGFYNPLAGCSRFRDHTQWHDTFSRTPLDKWSARRRDFSLTTHNTHNRQTSMPPGEFEPPIPAGDRLQTHALDRSATGIGV